MQAKLEATTAGRERLRVSLMHNRVAAVVRDAAREFNVTLDAYPDCVAAAIADGLSVEGDDIDAGRVLAPDGRSATEWLADKLEQRRHWRGAPRTAPRKLFS